MPDVWGDCGRPLKSFIERIERLEEERKTLSDDIKEVYAEAKGTGFDTKIMRQIIRLRRWTRTTSTSRKPCSTSISARSGCSRRSTPQPREAAAIPPPGPVSAQMRRSEATSASASASVTSKRQTKRPSVGAAPVELEAVAFERVHRRGREVEENLVGLDRRQQLEPGEAGDPARRCGRRSRSRPRRAAATARSRHRPSAAPRRSASSTRPVRRGAAGSRARRRAPG